MGEWLRNKISAPRSAVTNQSVSTKVFNFSNVWANFKSLLKTVYAKFKVSIKVKKGKAKYNLGSRCNHTILIMPIYLIYIESEVLTSKKIVMVNEKGLTISFAQVYIFLNWGHPHFHYHSNGNTTVLNSQKAKDMPGNAGALFCKYIKRNTINLPY